MYFCNKPLSKHRGSVKYKLQLTSEKSKQKIINLIIKVVTFLALATFYCSEILDF